MPHLRDTVWMGVFVILVVFAVPWFLWGNRTVIAGLPIWLWWHIGWLLLTAVAFSLFTRDAWDRLMGVNDTGSGHDQVDTDGDGT